MQTGYKNHNPDVPVEREENEKLELATQVLNGYGQFLELTEEIQERRVNVLDLARRFDVDIKTAREILEAVHEFIAQNVTYSPEVELQRFLLTEREVRDSLKDHLENRPHLESEDFVRVHRLISESNKRTFEALQDAGIVPKVGGTSKSVNVNVDAQVEAQEELDEKFNEIIEERQAKAEEKAEEELEELNE